MMPYKFIGELWQSDENNAIFWQIMWKDALRFSGRKDEYLDDDLEELSRLYVWLYRQDSLPHDLPSKHELVHTLFLDEDMIVEFNEMIRKRACLPDLDSEY